MIHDNASSTLKLIVASFYVYRTWPVAKTANKTGVKMKQTVSPCIYATVPEIVPRQDKVYEQTYLLLCV